MTIIDPSAAATLLPVAAPAVVAPAAPVVAAPVQVNGSPSVGEPEWLNGRIAQAKQSAQAEILKSLGVDSVEAAKVAVAAAAAKADAEKTAETRAAELKAKLDAETARGSEQQKVIAEIAARQMVVLTAEQKSAVMAIAGDDAGAQLRAIAALQPTWAQPAAAVPAVAAAPTAASPAPNTAPGHTAPSGAGGSPPNHQAVFDQLEKTNPFAAANYGLRHPDDVFKPRT